MHYRIGCNWSRALNALIISKRVNIDYIKVGAFGAFGQQFETMRSLRPILLHGLGHFEHAGMKDIGIVDFDRAKKLITACGSPHYGLHMAIMHADMSKDMNDDEIQLIMSKNIQIFKERLSVPLLLENVPDSPEERIVFDHYPFVAPKQINALLTNNDAGFLLDLSHARVAALYRGWDIYDYVKALPLQRVKEIHVNGSGYDEQGHPSDTHEAMKDEDYALLDWVLTFARPDIITLEYNGVSAETDELVSARLYDQLAQLNDIVRR